MCGEGSCWSGLEAGCGERERSPGSLVWDGSVTAMVQYFHNAARGEGLAED